MDLAETAQVLELPAVAAAPCRLREVDQGTLEALDSGDEVELGGAAGPARQRRLLDAVGESLETRKRLGDRARNVDPFGPLEGRQQLGDFDPDGREQAAPLTGRGVRRGRLSLEPGLREVAAGEPRNPVGPGASGAGSAPRPSSNSQNARRSRGRSTAGTRTPQATVSAPGAKTLP